MVGLRLRKFGAGMLSETSRFQYVQLVRNFGLPTASNLYTMNDFVVNSFIEVQAQRCRLFCGAGSIHPASESRPGTISRACLFCLLSQNFFSLDLALFLAISSPSSANDLRELFGIDFEAFCSNFTHCLNNCCGGGFAGSLQFFSLFLSSSVK